METTKTTEPLTTYNIPDWNLGYLEKQIGKINKRGAKLGCTPVEIIIHGEVFKTDPKYIDIVASGAMTAEEAPKIRLITISLKGEPIKLAGWSFIGTLDHYSLPGKVIVNTVPGNEIPKQFHNSEPVCNHCGKIRHRVETFVVKNNDEYKQIGRRCLKDFLGHDPNRIASYLSHLYALVDELGDEEGEYHGRGQRQEYYFDLKTVLAWAVGSIRTFGWVPRSAAGGNREATATTVLKILNPGIQSAEREHSEQLRKDIGLSDEDYNEVTKALEWLSKQEDNNEYIHNLKAIADSGLVTYKLMGYACSIISTYHKAMDKLNLQKTERKLNEWVGAVKDKIETTVTILRVVPLAGVFGVVNLHRMIDDSGRTLVWFANTSSGMHEGKKYRVKGTVKKHDTYNEWKQTIVTRVKKLDEIVAPN